MKHPIVVRFCRALEDLRHSIIGSRIFQAELLGTYHHPVLELKFYRENIFVKPEAEAETDTKKRKLE